jgi:hypothetical protein
VVVWEGVGLGAGGVEGALTVGFGVGLWVVGAGVGCALEVARFGAAAGLCLACRFGLWLGDGLALALPEAFELAGPDGLVDGVPACEVVVTAGAEWLNRFMNPTAPTALSKVARQVSVESLRRPSSRRKVSRSLCRMGANEIGTCVKSPPRAVQGDTLISGDARPGLRKVRVDWHVP